MNDYGSSGPTADDVELFGQDLVEFAQRAAAPVVNQRTADLQRQLNAMQSELAQQRVQSELDRDPVLRDRWRQVNIDPAFLAFLDEVDDLAGEKRMELLRRAYHYGNADVVANIFRAFAVGKMPGRTTTQLPYGRTRTATPADNSPRRIWRREEIARFYEDVRKGRYADREIEKLKVEREIAAAAREGRVANPPMKMFGDK